MRNVTGQKINPKQMLIDNFNHIIQKTKLTGPGQFDQWPSSFELHFRRQIPLQLQQSSRLFSGRAGIEMQIRRSI